MQNFFEKFASNLVFAAFIPTLIFSVLANLVFGPLISDDLRVALDKIFKESSAFTIVCAVVLSFIVLYSRELIYSFYRGLFLGFMSSNEGKRARKIQNKISNLETKIQSSEDEILIEQLRNRHYSLVANYLSSFPSYYEDGLRQDGELLPTQFGNILRAAEFSCRRYGMDAVHIWPRLIHVIPEKNHQKIEEVNNQMFLLLNFSFLSFFFGLANFVVKSFFRPQSINSHSFWIIGLLSFGSFYLFYKLSLPLARSYANMYRSAFDLFRFDLLRSMNEELPKDSNEEVDTWRRISEAIAVGECYGDLYCRYPYSSSITNETNGLKTNQD